MDAGRTNLKPETAKKKFVRAMEVLPDALSHATQPCNPAEVIAPLKEPSKLSHNSEGIFSFFETFTILGCVTLKHWYIIFVNLRK